jgi:Tol biopolymer transport system component
VTRAPNLTYTPGAVFTLGVILPQTPGAPPAPSSNAIVFVRDSQIFAVNADGSGLIQLTTGPGRQFRPTRNGSQIAFYSDRDGNMEIYVMANNGTSQARLTADGGSDSDPAWSWPGDVIAFASSRSGGTDIYTMRGDGSSLALVVGDAAQDRWPSWAPVGGRLVFASNRDGGDFDLFAANADGSGLAQLTANTVDDTAPAWSPDGNRIAYVSGGNVWVMNADGSNPRPITSSGGVQALAWSPVGNEIAYSRGGDLYVIGADGGTPVRVTSGGSQDTDPSWAR